MLDEQIETLTRQITADATKVWAQILKEQVDLAHEWWHIKPPVRHSRLRDFEQTVRTLIQRADDAAAHHVLGAVEAAYEIGVWNTSLWAGIPNQLVQLNMVDFDTISYLAQETMQDLLAATTHISNQTKTVIRELSRTSVVNKTYTGKTAEQAGIELATDLRANGIRGVIYKNGTAYPLDAYTQMVTRTKTAEAYQIGGFNQGERLDIDYWEVFDGHDCGWTSHDDPVKANGKIVRLDEARQYPIAHPNCLRSTSPRPDIRSWKDAATAEPSTTEAQRANQKAAEIAREQARKTRPLHVAQARRSASLQNRRDAVIRARQGLMTVAEQKHYAMVEKVARNLAG